MTYTRNPHINAEGCSYRDVGFSLASFRAPRVYTVTIHPKISGIQHRDWGGKYGTEQTLLTASTLLSALTAGQRAEHFMGALYSR